MFVYSRINKQREELCAREGITEDMKDRYRDDGDSSPLYRYVSVHPEHLGHIYSFFRLVKLQILTLMDYSFPGYLG